jgi:hypothetical protein
MTIRRSFLIAAACFAVACTQSQLKTASNVDEQALTDTQAACAAAAVVEAVEPVTVPFITAACPALVGLEGAVATWLNNLEAAKPAVAARLAARRKAAAR